MNHPPDRAASRQRQTIPPKEHATQKSDLLLMLIISISAIGFSMIARNAIEVPGLFHLLGAGAVALLFIPLLSAADVVRAIGIRANRELGARSSGGSAPRETILISCGAAFLQVVLVFLFDEALLPLLLVCWAYLILMLAESYLRGRLEANVSPYMISYIFFFPLVALLLTAFDWLAAGAGPPPGLAVFLAMSFFAGATLELGRKMRAPDDEHPIVGSYTSSWGRTSAINTWISVLVCSAVFAIWTAYQVEFAIPTALITVLLLAPTTGVGIQFMQSPSSRRARLVGTLSVLWTLALYVCVGILPVFLR